MNTFDITYLLDSPEVKNCLPDDATIIELKPISYFQAAENQTNLENKAAALILLNVTTPRYKLNTNTRVQQYGTGGNKRFKPTKPQGKPYDRFFLFGDLVNPPACVCITTQTSTDSRSLLSKMLHVIGIGTACYLFEPNFSTQAIANSLPIISSPWSCLLPFKSKWPIFNTPITFPTNAGEHSYFMLTKEEVVISRVVVSNDPSCSGIFCDRQKPGQCSCFFTKQYNKSFIIEMDIGFKVPSEIETLGYCTVRGFRSLRTSQIFFDDMDGFGNHHFSHPSEKTSFKLRPPIKEMVAFVNNNDGWNLAGWYRLGEIYDAQNDDEKIANEHLTLHISYAYPSSPDKTIELEEFKKMRIKTVTHQPALNEGVIDE